MKSLIYFYLLFIGGANLPTSIAKDRSKERISFRQPGLHTIRKNQKGSAQHQR